MNQNVRKFIQYYIEPNKEIIINRSLLFSLVLQQNGLPRYVYERFEDIKKLTLLGADSTVMKLIPNFLEDLLISIMVSVKTSSRNEFYSNQRKTESMNVKKVFADLKDMAILNHQDKDFCERYFGTSNIRNKEIHNKEVKIFESLGEIVTTNTITGEQKKAEQVLVDLIESSPELMRILNHNDRVSRVQIEVYRLYSLICNNITRLSKLTNLPDEKMADYLDSQKKGKKLLLNLSDTEEYTKVEEAIRSNFDIMEYREIGVGSFELEYKSEISTIEASLYFLPVTTGNLRMEIIN